MKRPITFALLLAIAFCITLINPLTAQNINNDINALAKRYENAYNHKDAKALKWMYTKNAVRVAVDGSTTTGNDAISDSLAVFFKHSKVMIEIKVDTTVQESDGSITATGSYHVSGTTDKGEKIDMNGLYNNTIVKEDDKWKIAKSVLTSM